MLIPPLLNSVRKSHPTGGLRLCRNDGYVGTTLEARLELDGTVHSRKQGVVFGEANIVTGMELRATLTNEDVACDNCLTTEFF